MHAPAQKILFDEACNLASLQQLSLREASTLVGAEPRHYVRVRNISQSGLKFRLLNYFRIQKIERLREQLDTETVVNNDHPIVLALEERFSRLEFGVNPFKPLERKRIRGAILWNDYSLQAVQCAFRSLAVSISRHQIMYREVNTKHVKYLGHFRDFIGGALIALYAMIFHELMIDGCITCSLAGWAFLASHTTAILVLACRFMQDAVRGSLIIKSMKLGQSHSS